MPQQLICSICNKPIPAKGTWRGGNSAEPINSGRCCDDCDNTVVIPRRLLQMRKARYEAEES
jgi:hypothetical protein